MLNHNYRRSALLRLLFRLLAVAIAHNDELTTCTLSRPAELTTDFNVTKGVEILHESEKYIRDRLSTMHLPNSALLPCSNGSIEVSFKPLLTPEC